MLVNVSSALGRMGQPYMGIYLASKFAINGLAGSLRMELMDVPDVHVCTVLPDSMDTPHLAACRQLHRPRGQAHGTDSPPGGHGRCHRGNLHAPEKELNAIAGGLRESEERRTGRLWLAGFSALGLGLGVACAARHRLRA